MTTNYTEFTPTYYNVTITNISGAAPSDGFIDKNKAEEYDTLPSTNDTALAKERANLRWIEMMQNLSLKISPIHVLNYVAVDATADVEPTSISFTLVYDRPSFLMTEDETDNNNEIYDMDAIKRFIARAMIESFTRATYMAGPVVSAGTDVEYTGIKNIEVGELTDSLVTAESAITVAKI